MAINAERLYENACEALRRACVAVHDKDEEAGNYLYKMMVKEPEIYLHASDRIYWYEALPALEIYLMAKDELGKSKGGTAYSAVKRFIKGCPDSRPSLKGVWYDTEGRQCMCDGYHALRLVKPVIGFETVTGMDLEKVFPNDGYFTDPVELTIPTPGELKINKRKLGDWRGARSVYDFGDDLPRVNADYLKNIMDCLPGATAVCDRSKINSGMIYFTSDNGDAILLPVRKKTA